MTSEEQVATLLRLKGAEGAVAYLLGYIEMREIEIKHFAHRGHTLKTIGDHIEQMEVDSAALSKASGE